MHSPRWWSRAALVVCAVATLALSGCGIATALAIGAITDAIEGDNDDGGDPTILTVRNDGASTEAIVQIQVARTDGAEPPSSYDVDIAPGSQKQLKNIFDAGTHWVRVRFASGWRARARGVDVIKDQTVSTTFTHGTPALAGLAGTWFGPVDDGGTARTWAFSLDGTGGATGRTIDGIPGTTTGVVVETSDGVYRLSWSDGLVTALVADGVREHLALLTATGATGTLEKGANPPLAVAVDGDIVGGFVGVQVRFTGATLTPTDLDAATATISAQAHWTGSDGDGDATAGVTPLVLAVPSHGLWAGDAEDEATTALDLALVLAPDHTVLTSVLAPTVAPVFPDDFTVQLLEKVN